MGTPLDKLVRISSTGCTAHEAQSAEATHLTGLGRSEVASCFAGSSEGWGLTFLRAQLPTGEDCIRNVAFEILLFSPSAKR